MKPRFKTVPGPLFGLLILALVLPSTACETFEPTMFPVGDTVELYSLARPEYIGQRSGFDFIVPRSVVVEEPKGQQFADFDIAFSELEDEFVLLPAGLFESFDIDPGIAVDTSGVSFEELTRAPSSGYATEEAVPIRPGPIYVVRTRQDRGSCSRYAKVEVLELDPEGILEFRFLRNNLCNDRTLTDIDED